MTLADKIEALDGPDREVDVEIAVTVFGMERDGNNLLISDDCDFVLERGYYDHAGNPDELPYYTASLDAAKTLYPVLPETIPSCPRKAAAAAIRARG